MPLRVVGLGPGDPKRIPERNWKALREASTVLVRTERHPAVEALRKEGISFTTCDDLYETSEIFEELYERIADRAACLPEDAVFAIPGHPLVGEESVQRLRSRRSLEILPAPSFIETVLEAVGLSLTTQLQVWDAHAPEQHWPDPRAAQMVYQLDSPLVASQAKLHLLRFFPEEHPVFLVDAAGTEWEKVRHLPLHLLDHQPMSPLTTAFLEGIPLERPHGFYGLVEIVDRLLGPGGCPWDQAQTHETLKKHLLEETYETIEAIDSGDPDKLCEELGDLLLQPVLHAQMDAIEGLYDIDDVIRSLSEKLIRRHPHVFGDENAPTPEEVLRNWDRIKKEERGTDESILAGVPTALPALLRAHEVSKRAARVGFEWPSVEAVWEKVREEEQEFLLASQSGDAERAEEELGDLLFSLVNVARWHGIDPEEALRKMVSRFCERFSDMERSAGKELQALSPEELDALWERAKRSTK
jgi:tetrapyrrole methylase family protein/MazG family protein